jgi:mRNA interferase MazF
MRSGTRYSQGDIVIVPFPFTDLEGQKKRPALVVSPNWFNDSSEDVVLSAMTSAIPNNVEVLKSVIVVVSPEDVNGPLPALSIVKVTKYFTCSQDIIAKKVADLKTEKMDEVLHKIRRFFAREFFVHENLAQY